MSVIICICPVFVIQQTMHFPYYSTPQFDQLLHFPHRAPLNSASEHIHTFGSNAGFYTGNTPITFQYDYMYIC